MQPVKNNEGTGWWGEISLFKEKRGVVYSEEGFGKEEESAMSLRREEWLPSQSERAIWGWGCRTEVTLGSASLDRKAEAQGAWCRCWQWSLRGSLF